MQREQRDIVTLSIPLQGGHSLKAVELLQPRDTDDPISSPPERWGYGRVFHHLDGALHGFDV